VLPDLATERTTLTPAGERDVDALHALFTDPIVRRFLWDDVVIERAQAAEVVAASLAQNGDGRGLWVIRSRDDGAMLGCVALLAVGAMAELEPRMAGGVEVLVALDPAAHGRGLATEALAVLIAHAWRALAVDALFAAVDLPNVASHRAMLRAGFEPMGECEGPRHRLRSYRLERPESA